MVAQRHVNVEPARAPRAYRHFKPQYNKKTIQKPTNPSVITRFYRLLHFSSCTYRYLQAALEYERVIKENPTTKKYLIEYHRKLAGDITTPTRSLEIAIIMVKAGLHHEDVPDLAFILEDIVRHLERLRFVISELFLKYAMQHPWGRHLVGFWPAKLTLGFLCIVQGFVFNVGTGRCWWTVACVVAFLLVGPVFTLLHMGTLELKEVLVFAYAIGRYQRWF